MVKNLRDKGYPGTTKSPRMKTRTARVVPGTAQIPQKAEIPEGTEQWEQAQPSWNYDQIANDRTAAYSKALNYALKKANIPLETGGSTMLYEPDYNWGKYTESIGSLWTNDDDPKRLGFASHIHNFDPQQPDTYHVGTDIFEPLLENTYHNGQSKSFKLPLGIQGKVGIEDGVLYGTADVPQKQYYLGALLNMLRR